MSFIDKLNEQIGYEFAASQQYIAIAVYYDAETLPRLAATFYQQAVEERNHAMMLVQYLLDVGETVDVCHEPDKRRDAGALRVRLPRRQLRVAQHPERRSLRGARSRVGDSPLTHSRTCFKA